MANKNQIITIQAGTPGIYDINNGDIIGRAGMTNNIGIKTDYMSAQHGMFTIRGGRCFYRDLGSLNGSYINFRRVESSHNVPSREYMLNDGDIISVDPGNAQKLYIVYSSNTKNYRWIVYPTSGGRIAVGRESSNDMVLPDISSSRHHAVFECRNGSVSLTDLNSTNGTFVDGNIIHGTVQLRSGSQVSIASSKIYILDDCMLCGIAAEYGDVDPNTGHNRTVHQAAISPQAGVRGMQLPKRPPIRGRIDGVRGGMSIQVRNVSRVVKCRKGTGINGTDRKKILDDISLTIESGEFVAILGGSGAGKTTFMNCLNGFEPSTSGTVLVDSKELVKDGRLKTENYNALKVNMGYVPQQDIVHENLTLGDMLTYTGKLRLNPGTKKADLDRRVTSVLETLDLSAHRDTMIRRLSGGQKKRASIAVELLSDPQLMFLDEPTSGLDPEAETNLMHCLSNCSKTQGKTIIVITHTLQNIDLFDKVIFLAPGGKLAFCGSPADARKFFEVDNLTEAYDKIHNNINGYVNRYKQQSNAYSIA